MSNSIILFGGDYSKKIKEYFDFNHMEYSIKKEYSNLSELELTNLDVLYSFDTLIILDISIVSEEDKTNLKSLEQALILLPDLKLSAYYICTGDSYSIIKLNKDIFDIIQVRDRQLTGETLSQILNGEYVTANSISKEVEIEATQFKLKERKLKLKTSSAKSTKQLGFWGNSKKEKQKDTYIYKTFRPKVVSFLGGSSGVGVTTTVLNTGLALAERGFKVLLLEYSSDSGHLYPWLQVLSENKEQYSIANMYNCIDTNNLGELNNTYINVKEHLMNLGVGELYPEGLFVSSINFQNIVPNMKVNLSRSNILFTHLIYQEAFDFILLDIDRNLKLEDKDLVDLYLSGSERVLLLSQDISIYFDLLELKNSDYILKNTNHRVISKYNVLNKSADKLIEKYYLKEKIDFKLSYVGEMSDHIAKMRFTYLESSKLEDITNYTLNIDKLCDELEK